MAKLFINKDIAPDTDKYKYWLTGEDSVSFSDIQYFIDWMPSDDNRIDVEIHSCGGDCVEGYAIYDALRASGKEISCKVVGRCASMATVILLAAPLERRTAYAHSELLIHSPYYGSAPNEILTVANMEAMINELNSDKEKMLALYTERTGKTREVLEAQMATDSWFSPEKAIELGFISSIVPAISAKVELNINQNPKGMTKGKETAVPQSLLDRLLKKCGYAKIEDVPTVGLVITTSTGDELNVEREEGEIQVGDPASPDGEHVLEDGRTVVVQDGVITEIKEPGSEDEDVDALKARIDELEAENKELKENAKSEEDVKILAAVKDAGGIDKLTKAASSKYTPAGRVQPTNSKKNDAAPVGIIQKKLAEAREKNKNRYQKK